MEYDHGDSFSFDSEPNGILFGLKSNENCYHDHIPLNLKRNGTLSFSVQPTYILVESYILHTYILYICIYIYSMHMYIHIFYKLHLIYNTPIVKGSQGPNSSWILREAQVSGR